MLDHPEQLKLGGEKREMTVLFSDIRGFTTLSERMAPEELVELHQRLPLAHDPASSSRRGARSTSTSATR